MKLSRTTPCNVFNIKKPIWSGRKVGLNEQNIGTHNEVKILHKRADGTPLHPEPFYISGEQARKYPKQKLKNYPITLLIIPIEELERLERI